MVRIPLVILEGPDGSGKSTLVVELEQMWCRIRQGSGATLPWVTKAHNGPPGARYTLEIDGYNESVEEYSLRLQSRLTASLGSYDPTNGQHLHIIDRAHLGSYVYGGLFRAHQSVDGWGELGPIGFQRVDNAFAAFGAVLAILAPSNTVLLSRAVMRDDPYLDELIDADMAAEPRGEFDKPGRSTRRIQQITEISVMYERFIVQHADKFATYNAIGYPYYLSDDSEYSLVKNTIGDSLPAIASETDVRLVAADILGHAIDQHIGVMRSIINDEERRIHP